MFFLSTGPLLFLCRTAKIGLKNIILGSVWQAVTRHIPIRVGSHSAQQSLTAPRTARAGSHPCHWGRLLEYITKERGSIPTKCFNHPDQDAVATCQKCGKGLCRECAAKYMPCMCDACVEWEQNVRATGKTMAGSAAKARVSRCAGRHTQRIYQNYCVWNHYWSRTVLLYGQFGSRFFNVRIYADHGFWSSIWLEVLYLFTILFSFYGNLRHNLFLVGSYLDKIRPVPLFWYSCIYLSTDQNNLCTAQN